MADVTIQQLLNYMILENRNGKTPADMGASPAERILLLMNNNIYRQEFINYHLLNMNIPNNIFTILLNNGFLFNVKGGFALAKYIIPIYSPDLDIEILANDTYTSVEDQVHFLFELLKQFVMTSIPTYYGSIPVQYNLEKDTDYRNIDKDYIFYGPNSVLFVVKKKNSEGNLEYIKINIGLAFEKDGILFQDKIIDINFLINQSPYLETKIKSFTIEELIDQNLEALSSERGGRLKNLASYLNAYDLNFKQLLDTNLNNERKVMFHLNNELKLRNNVSLWFVKSRTILHRIISLIQRLGETDIDSKNAYLTKYHDFIIEKTEKTYDQRVLKVYTLFFFKCGVFNDKTIKSIILPYLSNIQYQLNKKSYTNEDYIRLLEFLKYPIDPSVDLKISFSPLNEEFQSNLNWFGGSRNKIKNKRKTKVNKKKSNKKSKKSIRKRMKSRKLL